MTPTFFKIAYDHLKDAGLVRTQAEFGSAIGVGPQWLKTLGHSARRYTQVRESTVSRFRSRLRWWERTAPRLLKPIFGDLLAKLDEAERIETILRTGR